MAVALSTAMVVTLGYAADIKTKAADDYTYLYAGLTWDQYWDAEDIYLQSTKVLLMLFEEQLQIMDFIEEVISVILLSMVKMEVSLMYLIGQQMEKHFISQTEQVYHTAKELSQRLTVHRQN